MAGIEKVCEATKDGHWDYTWYLEDYIKDCKREGTPINENLFGLDEYRDNIQVCEKHRNEMTKRIKGKKHRIIVFRKHRTATEDRVENIDDHMWKWCYKPVFYYRHNGKYRFGPWESHQNFVLFIEDEPCPYTESPYWMRWFSDKRRFIRNMRKLLGVQQLNIRNSSLTYNEWCELKKDD